MPYYDNNLDDLLAFDGIRSFTGGQASGLQSDQLAQNQVQEMYNMTLSVKGSLETRLGATAFNSTATTATGSIGGFRFFDTAQYEDVVNVAQGRLYTINSNGSADLHPPDQTWNSITRTWGSELEFWSDGFSSDPDVAVSMAQFNDKMFMADADGPLSYWDGQVASRQAGKVRAITVTTGGTGYTSATAIVSGPNWGGTAPTLTTTVAGGAVTGVVVVEGGSGYAYTPTVTIVGNGSGATATATVSPPPQNLRLLINTGNRLFAVGSGVHRNTLYASDILDPSVWDASNSIVVNADDGDEITAIVQFYQNRIIVFKKRRVFQVTIPPDATSAADWIVELISNNVGCVASQTAVQVNSDVFFLADDGLRSVVRSASDDFTTVGLPISEIVKDVIQEINTAEIGIAAALFYDNRYFLAIPTGANDYNDTLLVYNTVLQAFEGTWSPQVMQFTLSNFSGQGVRALGKAVNGVILQYNGHKSPAQVTTADYQDAGVSYESYVRTKDFDFGDPFAEKHGSHFEVVFDDSFSTDTTITIQRDTDVGDIDVQPNLNISSAVLTLPFVLPAQLPSSVKKRLASDLRAYQKWRLLNIKIASAASKLAIRQITAAANPDTIEVQKTL
jgi:hypothetical protein